jgi:hypothetical protein
MIPERLQLAIALHRKEPDNQSLGSGRIAVGWGSCRGFDDDGSSGRGGEAGLGRRDRLWSLTLVRFFFKRDVAVGGVVIAKAPEIGDVVA